MRERLGIALAIACVLLSLGLIDRHARVEIADRADAVCRALTEERFQDAVDVAAEGLDGGMAGRRGEECACIAELSLRDRDACLARLDRVYDAHPTWLPHFVLAKLRVRNLRERGEIREASVLASRAAQVYDQDLDLLQLELMLRAQIENEDGVFESIRQRIEAAPADADTTPARIVLATAWLGRGAPAPALAVLGETPPPPGHPLHLPWFETRIDAQATAGDLAAVKASFAQWRAMGADPIDLQARYALRLSVSNLPDPEHSSVSLLRGALEHAEELRDPRLVWALYRRLIGDLLGAGDPEAALATYDEATRTIALPDVSRESLLRAVRLAERDRLGGNAPRDKGRLRFVLPSGADPGTLRVAPDPVLAPDAGYERRPIRPGGSVEVVRSEGTTPVRWVFVDADGRPRASGAVWPEPEARRTIDIAPRPAAPGPKPFEATELAPGDGRRRVFALVPDCGDWRLLEYLRARGELPFHDFLMERAHHAVLESRPAFTAAAMQSLVWPGERPAPSAIAWVHRMGLELAGLESVGRNPFEFLSAILPERANLFEVLGAGDRVVANMLLSHGQIDAGRNAEVIGPGGARRMLQSQRAFRMLDEDEAARFPELLRDPATSKHVQTIAAEFDAAESLVAAGEVDFLFLRLEALDLITHAHVGPLLETVQDDGRGPLLAAYRYIDERLAHLRGLLDADDVLVVLSDHGIRNVMEHEEDAYLFVVGGSVPAGRAPGQPDLRGVPRMLAALLGERVDWPETGVAAWATDVRHADARP